MVNMPKIFSSMALHRTCLPTRVTKYKYFVLLLHGYMNFPSSVQQPPEHKFWRLIHKETKGIKGEGKK